ncbi:hypothetical protein Ae201684P_000109 [Aphanomyces euteiches]|uniref:NAD(P)H-hydrate epimerase n=1 Tax=Aphanomyces euteiches TaxID=100861 RepID=A0A6G0XRF9_9STRA|nr:hypothetical protein Ae201684_002201 [Aphanomyces euteiches]KAH9086687.1 hypothetical protein Ae201684P_000109 [Aphanomyces euteiches]KAH9139829.1 hypothetical protein AeRB84_015897 [Aphanomyces euteiches]
MSRAHGLLRYLTQAQAQRIDEELMSTYAFSIDQLMELAGLSVACVVQHEFSSSVGKPLLVVAGPGNNGGDALVAARHLKHFGFLPEILYPKETSNPLYQRLLKQCRDLDIPFVGDLPQADLHLRYSLVLDGIFGFSFKGAPRPPFDSILQTLTKTQAPIVSIDIPSGWDVEQGNKLGTAGLSPQILVSLTAPKLCAEHFKGKHYVGGRFVPRALAADFNLATPAYVGSQQFALWSERDDN